MFETSAKLHRRAMNHRSFMAQLDALGMTHEEQKILHNIMKNAKKNARQGYFNMMMDENIPHNVLKILEEYGYVVESISGVDAVVSW